MNGALEKTLALSPGGSGWTSLGAAGSRYVDLLEGPAYAHAKVEYQLKIEYKDATGYDLVQASPQELTLPNYDAAPWVSLRKTGAPETEIARLDASGLSYASGVSGIVLKKGEGLLALPQGLDAGLDPEGDAVGLGLVSTPRDTVGSAEGTVTFSPSAAAGALYSLAFSFTETKGSYGRTWNLPAIEGLRYDAVAPELSGNWRGYSAAREEELGDIQNGESSGPLAKLRIGAAEPSTDAVKSGVTEIALWNAASPGSVRPAGRIELAGGGAMDLRSVLTASGLTALEAGNSAVVLGVGEGEATELLWPFLSGAEGLRYVRAEAVDLGGNAKSTEYNFFLDTTAPVAPAAIDYDYEGTEHGIVVGWASATDAVRYYVLRNGRLSEPIVPENRECRYEPETEGLGAGEALSFGLIAEDAAGNRSEPETFTVYGYVPLASLKAERGYERLGEGAVRRYHRFTVEDSPIGVQSLEYSKDGTTGWSKLSYDSASRSFLHDDLGPHGNFFYRQRSASADGHESATGSVFEYPGAGAANFAPEAAAGTSPGTFAGAAPRFQWSAAFDADADGLSYELYYREAGSGGAYAVLGPTAELGLTAAAGVFADGKDYEWFVRALDGRGGSADSAERRFRVDGRAPRLSLSAPEGLFTASESLSFSVEEENLVEVRASFIKAGTSTALPVTRVGGNEWSLGLGAMAGAAAEATIEAEDAAGNITRLKTGELRVDRTPPEVLGLTLDAGGGFSAEDEVPAVITVSDEYSGVRSLHYGVTTSPSGNPGAWRSLTVQATARPEGSAGSRAVERSLRIEGVDGVPVYVVLEAEDWAGNVSERYRAGSGVKLDRSAPTAELTITGLKTVDGGVYATALDGLGASLEHRDPESGSTASYGLAEGEEEPGSWHESFAEARAGMEAGKRYRIYGRAVNGAGLATTVFSESFLYDPSGPTSLALSLPGAMRGGMVVRVVARAADAESGLRRLGLALGTKTGGTQLSERLAGSEGGWIWASPKDGEAVFTLLLPEDGAGNYYPSLVAENRAGLRTAETGGSPSVAVGVPEGMVVYDEGPCAAATESLKGRWKYYGAETLAAYEYRAVDEAGNPVGAGALTGGWRETVEESGAIEGLELEGGSTYYLEARARYAEGGESAVGRSLGVLIDPSAPEILSLETPEATGPRGPCIRWEGKDEESGLSRVEARLLEVESQGELKALGEWRSLPAEASGEAELAIGDDLAKTGGRLVAALRLSNGAGLTREGRSAVIIVDPTAPPTPVVTDQGEVINAAQELEAHWAMSEEDPESGTVSYAWALSTRPADRDDLEWHEVGRARSAKTGFRGAHGETWYVLVRATNGAGLTSIGASDGIGCDSTAPFIAGVRLLSGSGSEELYYLSSKENLRLYVDATEDLSDITGYGAVLGSYDSEKKEWTALEGSGATYESTEPFIALSPGLPLQAEAVGMFRGEAHNASGESQTGYSAGMIYDPAEPEIASMVLSRDAERVYFLWEPKTSRIPVTSYEASLERSGSSEKIEREGEAESRSWTVSLEGLEEGRYTLRLRPINAAGLGGEEVRGPSFTVDRSPPTPTLTAPKYVSTRLAFSAEAFDPESGVEELEYCLGTELDEDAYSGAWVGAAGARLEKEIALGELERTIPDGSLMELRVRARNAAGLWSASLRSGAILVDLSPAAAPTVEAGAYTRSRNGVGDVRIGAEDAESGILGLEWSVQEPEATKRSWRELELPAGANDAGRVELEDLSLAGMDLAEGGTYVLAVRARNGAGDWSSEGLSSTIRVDSLAPTILFEGSGAEIAINSARGIGFTVSEAATATFSLLCPDGSTVTRTMNLEAGAGSYPFDASAEGSYELRASLLDVAGNVGNEGSAAVKAIIRLNAAPVLADYDPVTTRPGEPTSFRALAYDPDGDLPLGYRWDFGDGSATSTEEGPTHAYYHASAEAQASHYIARLTVTDALGKSTSLDIPVTVENSREGRLLVDECWSGEFEIRGWVVVPAGRTLTLSGALVRVKASLAGELVNGGIEVESGGRLAVANSSTSEVSEVGTGIPGLYWKGIRVRGRVEGSGLVVSGAERGMILEGGRIELREGAMEGNLIGLHLLGGTLLWEDGSLLGNEEYGIKEDGTGDFEVEESAFGRNGVNYYRSGETQLTIEELNALPGNGGNREVE